VLTHPGLAAFGPWNVLIVAMTGLTILVMQTGRRAA
jgi:hypothetical protein